MKKSILFLSFLLFAALFARGSDTKEVRLTFDGSDFSFAQENGHTVSVRRSFPLSTIRTLWPLRFLIMSSMS